jgi:ATP adenylyltransferase
MALGVSLAAGTLAGAVAERTRAALHAGALEPIATRAEVVEDAGIPFVVRVVVGPGRKPAATPRAPDRAQSPFLPCEPELFVADLSDTHFCLLNKYNVVDGHLLIATRRFEDQSEALDGADFAALALCQDEIDGLGFYNSSEEAGASQRHKHLQLVPRPGGSAEAYPLAARLEAAARAGEVTLAPDLPFPIAIAGVAALLARGGAAAAAALEATYLELAARLGMDPRRTPYNLLATRRLLALVPRARERWQGISLNALGFAGALLVPDAAALERLRAVGPLAALRAVAAPA